jgi:hypothetical protein
MDAGEETGLSPQFLAAVSVNESDLDEKSVRVSFREGKIYAYDGGLLGIHCVVDQTGKKCTNLSAKGMTVAQMMSPVMNIKVGARWLAHLRDDKSCLHKNHAWWSHYNHGTRYIDHGIARHYPQRVANLYFAMSTVLKMPMPEMNGVKQLTVVDKGVKPRKIDVPVGARQRRLFALILECQACNKYTTEEKLDGQICYR